MEITSKNIAEIAHRMLGFCNDRNIRKTEDILHHSEITYRMPDYDKQFIEFTRRPSNNSTIAHVFSYIWKGEGIILEARLNFSLDYTAMILKSRDFIPGYLTFAVDNNSTPIRNKNITNASYDIFIKELKELKICN
ncbi:MAG: hypothetical protein AABW65_00365 [Nanoarchaeota archaeon]